MQRRRSPTLSQFAAIVFLVMRAPRSARELASLLGLKPCTAARHLRALEAEGLVSSEKDDSRRHKPVVYTWVGVPPNLTT